MLAEGSGTDPQPRIRGSNHLAGDAIASMVYLPIREKRLMVYDSTIAVAIIFMNYHWAKDPVVSCFNDTHLTELSLL